MMPLPMTATVVSEAGTGMGDPHSNTPSRSGRERTSVKEPGEGFFEIACERAAPHPARALPSPPSPCKGRGAVSSLYRRVLEHEAAGRVLIETAGVLARGVAERAVVEIDPVNVLGDDLLDLVIDLLAFVGVRLMAPL